MATINLPQLVVQLQQMQTRVKSIRPVLSVFAASGVREIRDRFQTGIGSKGERWSPLKFPRPEGGGKPLLSSGVLEASFTNRVTEDTITIGTAQKQAPLMNMGGTVTPKKGRFLAIPLTKEAKRAGSPRRFRRVLHARFAKNGRTGVLVDRKGVEQYLLVQKVTVPARPFMGFSDQWRQDFLSAVTGYIKTGKL